MTQISLLVVASVSLAAFGCTKKKADCCNAVDRGVEVQNAQLSGMDAAMRGKMKDAALSHCKDDKWSDEVLQCMSEARADTDFKTCQGKLTTEQKSSMQQAMKDLMMASGMAPAGGGGATAGSATAGSAAAAGSGYGSAGALLEEHP